MIVFVSTCASVDFHHQLFSHSYWPYQHKRDRTDASETSTAMIESGSRVRLLECPLWKLHGSIEQSQRTSTFHAFAQAATGILLCTDVAARGLDLPAVDWIVQYDAAEVLDDYVHRVGRTARMGRQGKAVLFVTEAESKYLELVESTTQHKLNAFSIAKTLTSLRTLQTHTTPHFTLDDSTPAGALLQRLFESLILGNEHLRTMAISAYQSWVRAYAGYPKAMKKMFNVKNLHFGHVCRSFALLDDPTAVKHVKTAAGAGRNRGDDDDDTTKNKTDKRSNGPSIMTKSKFNAKLDSANEFSAG